MLLVVILGFVVDGTRLMVIQGELQNATDACALAASAELNGLPGATFRATAAGSHVGGVLNKKNFQNALVDIKSNDVKFSDVIEGNYVAASAATSANLRYVQCTATYSGWVNLFMGLVGAGSAEPVAVSRAGQQPTRKVCVLPLALQTAATTGEMKNFLRVTDHQNATPTKTDSDYEELINGFGTCNIPTDLTKIQVRNPTDIDKLLNNRYKADPTFPDVPGQSNRRLIAVPSIKPDGSFIQWVCLELKKSSDSIQVSYLGSTKIPNSQCVVSGVTGFGAVGPPAPVLVR